jgi:hypothetical protein
MVFFGTPIRRTWSGLPSGLKTLQVLARVLQALASHEQSELCCLCFVVVGPYLQLESRRLQ